MKRLTCILFCPALFAASINNSLYRVYPVDYTQAIGHAQAPADTLPNLSLKVALGEYESGALVVRAKAAISSLTASATDFSNAATGRTILKDSVNLKHLEFAFTDAGQTQELPLRLWPNKGIAVGNGQNAQFWVTVHPANPLDTGTFTGGVVLNGDNTLCTLSVSFRVRPFKLLDDPNFYCGAFSGNMSMLSGPVARDLKAHGMDAIQFFWNSNTSWQITNVNGNLVVVFNGMDSVLQNLKAAGLRGPLIPSMGNDATAHMERDIVRAFPQFKLDTTFVDNKEKKVGPVDDPVFDTLIVSAIRQVKNKIESYGFEMVLLIYDEPTERFMTEFADRYQLLHAAFPSLRTYGVVMDQLQWAQEVAPYTDILVANGDFTNIMQYAAAQGKDYWVYDFLPASVEAGQARGQYGLRFWKYGPQGVFFWALNYYSGDPYVDYDGTGGAESDMAVIFPPTGITGGAPVGSPAWEGLREARDDWAYVHTLANMLTKSTSATGSAIRTPFNALKFRITESTFTSYSARYTVLDSIRGVVAGWIEQLLKAEPGKFGEMEIGVETAAVAENHSVRMISVQPNPFATSAVIVLSGKALDPGARLQVFDLAGKRVQEFSKELLAGSHGRVTWRSSGLAPGVYVLKLTSPRLSLSEKILLLK